MTRPCTGPHGLTSAEAPQQCRVAVVGAGLAGLETARHLALAGVDDVVVLEAGPLGDPRHNNVAGPERRALSHWLAPEHDPYFRRPWLAADPPHYERGSGLRQRVGGRSLYWYGVLLPADDWALTAPWWPQQVVADLTRSLYTDVTEDLRRWGGPPQPAAECAVDLAGYRLRPTPSAVRAGQGGWFAYSPLDHWRDPQTGTRIAGPGGVQIVADCGIDAVHVERGRARGVRLQRTGRVVRADAVVLAAGTVENSRLALGALGADRLTGLADHITQGVFIRFDGAAAARVRSELPPGSYYTPMPAALRSNLFLDVTDRGEGNLLIDLRLTGEQMPSPYSSVDALPHGGVTARVRLTDDDHALVSAQREAITGIWSSLPAHWQANGQLIFAPFDQPDRTNRALLDSTVDRAPGGHPVTWSSPLGTEDHEGGTLGLGTILDDNHQFHAVEGLYAAGPSTFPRLGAANPGLTTLALARRLAARLQRALAVSPRTTESDPS
ncbi:FAD-dependent oxidoreductase [Streptomyces erythrochromogenes]|uniref:FAD-dependent oxidoreductase n=1 Tax=Streptomyces erythrochromogenes TaxID=285574 RepID=UPI003636046E